MLCERMGHARGLVCQVGTVVTVDSHGETYGAVTWFDAEGTMFLDQMQDEGPSVRVGRAALTWIAAGTRPPPGGANGDAGGGPAGRLRGAGGMPTGRQWDAGGAPVGCWWDGHGAFSGCV